MPALIDKEGTSFWLITVNDGPWQVYSSYTTKYGATSSGWGVVNVCNGKHREIGSTSAAGIWAIGET